MSKRSPKKKESLPTSLPPPPTVSSRLSSLPTRTQPTNTVKPTPVVTTRPTPPVKISAKEPERITTQSARPRKIDDGDDDDDSDSDDSDWDLSEDGIDDEFAEHIYDFIKEQKKTDPSNKPLYNYMTRVFDDKEEFDEKKLDSLGIDRVMDTLSAKFTQYMINDGGESSPKLLTKDVLITYLDAGLDDNFEDDGWIVKDE
jgi:hypothetical protein